jgi:molybdopterin biosynthesis enzyme
MSSPAAPSPQAARALVLDFDLTTEAANVPAQLALGRALAADVDPKYGLTKGAALRPAHLALLAEMDELPVATFGPAGLGLVTIDPDITGNELPDSLDPHPAATALAATAGEGGALPIDLGRVPPRADLHLGAVRRAFEMAEIVCSIGAGPEDAAFIAAETGGELHFASVDHEPGGLAHLTCEDGWWFGLPSDPAAALALFRLYVLPLARKLAGHADFDLRHTTGEPGATFATARPTLLWAHLAGEADGFVLQPLHEPGAMTTAAAAAANVLVLTGAAGRVDIFMLE